VTRSGDRGALAEPKRESVPAVAIATAAMTIATLSLYTISLKSADRRS
jgi:hypothetical protein